MDFCQNRCVAPKLNGATHLQCPPDQRFSTSITPCSSQGFFKKTILVTLFLCSLVQVHAQRPTAAQLAWHDTEFYLFCHFGPNTFTDVEWGNGQESEDLFNPTDLNCDQWCKVALSAGAKGIVITAKHHDGFCLWPSAQSKHTVRESPWKQGKGDVLRELSDACKRHGLQFGVYLSPWDRHHPQYGTPAYNDVYAAALTELLTQYGPVFEMWWDGANGEGPNGKRQEYDFPRFERLTASLQPNTIVFSDIGPHCRWAGNEQGTIGTTNWCTLDTAGFKRGNGGPHTDTLQTGNQMGKHWIPAECDVSIRPGWFYHEKEDAQVKTPAQLWDIYARSVGRGANLILNVPPDRRGRIHARDSASLTEFGALLRSTFTQNLVTSRRKDVVQLQSKPFQYIRLKEDLRKGQHVAAFRVEVANADGKWSTVATGNTIGSHTLITLPAAIAAEYMRVVVTSSKGKHRKLRSIEVFGPR